MKKVFLLLVAAVFSLLSANAQKEIDLVISAGDSKQLILGGQHECCACHDQSAGEQC